MKQKGKDNPIIKVQLIVILTVLIASSCIYYVVYTLFDNAVMNDIQERAGNLKGYVQAAITTRTFEGTGSDAFEETRDALGQFREIAYIRHLYIATADSAGNVTIVMDSLYGDDMQYALNEEMAADLRLCLELGEVVHGKGIYHTDWGSIYAVYWPVFSQQRETLGAVGMEFDVTSIYQSYRQALVYSLAISAGLIILFCLAAYLSLHKMQEPYYKKLAYTDYLTGLENRMAFEQKLLQCETLIAEKKTVTFMIFDLNNLKTVNDTLGHKAGDQYIKNTALTIAEILKDAGEVYRIGGDEFAAILIDCAEEQAETLLETLRNEKRQVVKNVPFSCAAGASTFKFGADNNLRDVIDRADNNMYGEKKRQKGGAEIR